MAEENEVPDLKLPLKTYEVLTHKIIDFTRHCFSSLPKIGIVKPMPERPNGLSVIFRSCNDEWAELSLKSIKNFADEIIVIDASTDDTPARIKKVAREEGLNLNFIHMNVPLDSLMGDTETYVYHSNVGLRCAKYRWVIIWDADFIAYTNGPNNIMQLKKNLLDLDPEIYYRVNVGFLYLDGDLFHIGPWGFRIRREVFAFTWAPNVKFYNAGRFEAINFPLYYRRIIVPCIYAVHLVTVKNARYLLYRKYWTDWRENADFQCFPKLEDYVRYRLKKDYNTDSEEEGIRMAFAELAKNLVKCDYLLKNCPEVLKDELANPRYKIIYNENGKIIGRNDIVLK
ncbi:MAG: glycosyltransferase family 2 protein [Candidatus Bathyarchaeia archaeon]